MIQNFAQQLLQQVRQYPGKEILHVLIEQEYKHLTYQDLFEGSLEYQKYLKMMGVEEGGVVIIILPHSLDLIFAYFGCVLGGYIPSIMPYLTEKLIPEKYRQDLEALFRITEPNGVITFNAFSDEIQFLTTDNHEVCSIILVENIHSKPHLGRPEGRLENLPGLEINADDIALLQHSSGTTGLQKGVALSHQSIFNQLESYSEALKLISKDVIVSWLPLYHDMGLIAGFLMPIFLGIPLVLMSPFAWVRAPHLLMKAITDFKGTLCWLPNFAYNFCAKKIRPRDLDGIDLSTLRAVINCSEPMRKNSHDMFSEAFMDFGFNPAAIATSYAMAENVFAVTQGGIDNPVNYDVIKLIPFQEQKFAVPFDGDGPETIMVSAGKPIKGTEVNICDEDGNYLSERKIGEILIRSNCMLSGYFKRDDVTNNSFIDNWFKTGDFGYIADSELYITGRKKDLIIVGGKNIYPKDIETIVMEIEGVHPGRAVAFGVFNDQKGTEDVVVIAEIEDSHIERMDEIESMIRAKVTKESAIALRHVLTVNKKWLIKTSSGKIARALNKEKYLKEINQVP
jgi:fatty-acyl-CoA synthase